MIAVAAAYWLIRAGRDSGKPAVKRACIGLVFFKIRLLLLGISLIVVTCITGVLGLFGVLGLIISGTNFMGALGYALMIGGIAVGIGCCAVFFLKFYKLLVSLSNTMRLNRNLLVNEKSVLSSLPVVAIIWAVGSFAMGAATAVCCICQAICLILINSCFGDYKNALGFAAMSLRIPSITEGRGFRKIKP